MIQIKVVNRGHQQLPAYATPQSAGMDLRANIEEPIVLHPMERRLIPTGLHIALPEGYEAQVRPRSGLALKHGLTVLNSPGTIDADYRGEVGVLLINLSQEDFVINDGETHAIMGPNGSGKSTLSAVLVGNPLYEVTEGEAYFNGKNLLEMKPEDRAHEGLFLSFQYPVEIPGVSMTNFMKAAINEKRKYQGLEPMNAAEFLKLQREKRKIVELDSKLANRSVNEGFSGGEKKRNEIFQMAMLEPRLSILDETDSGLDVDAMRIVAEGVNKLQTPETSCIVITHYDRLLEMIRPQFVHVLYKGKIVKTGGPELAKEIQEHGYDWIKEEIGEE